MDKKIILENVQVNINHHKILDIDHLVIEEGDSVAILGSNGAGKTTLMNTILKLQKSDGAVVNDLKSYPYINKVFINKTLYSLK
ncbi:MAG: ABC transporter ATP-binding protein [Methanobrevibacter sp.]|jgi:ABC-type Mn2+/Zn2+ transport system ATPase subunit|nr:ABC transporter ATP-binding protein [Methanobrevibacter sp.]